MGVAMKIRGYVLDIQPNQPHPSLALYFGKEHRPLLPQGKRESIVLEFGQRRWHVTLNSVNPTNDPYVHTTFLGEHGTASNSTDVLLGLGLAEKAELEFDLNDRKELRLMRIVYEGKWRPGNALHERSVG